MSYELQITNMSERNNKCLTTLYYQSSKISKKRRGSKLTLETIQRYT